MPTHRLLTPESVRAVSRAPPVCATCEPITAHITVVVARAGVGKTQFCMDFCTKVSSINNNVPILHFDNGEMSKEELIVRQCSALSGVPMHLLETGRWRQAGQEIVDKVDFDRVFAGLIEAIEASKLGSMLAMVGGKEALEPLREPVTIKLKDIIAELATESTDGEASSDFTRVLVEKVEHIIDSRLDELTPENVKIIVQNMIRKHLPCSNHACLL